MFMGNGFEFIKEWHYTRTRAVCCENTSECCWFEFTLGETDVSQGLRHLFDSPSKTQLAILPLDPGGDFVQVLAMYGVLNREEGKHYACIQYKAPESYMVFVYRLKGGKVAWDEHPCGSLEEAQEMVLEYLRTPLG